MTQKLGDSFPEPNPVHKLMPHRKVFIVKDTKPTNTGGGTPTAGAFTIHVLNTVELNTIGGGASLSSNIITLPAGTYDVMFTAAGYYCSNFKIRLVDNTTGTVLADSLWGRLGGHQAVNISGFARITFTTSTTIRLEYYMGYSSGSSSLGYPVGVSPFLEEYAKVIFSLIEDSEATVGQRVTQHFGDGDKFLNPFLTSSQHMVCEAVFAQNTGGGSLTGGTAATVALNTEVFNSITGAYLSDNKIFLPAGRYILYPETKVYQVGGARINLFKVSSGGTPSSLALTAACDVPASYDFQCVLMLPGYTTDITEGQSIMLKVLAYTSKATYALGYPRNESGVSEVHARFTIVRVS